MAAWKRRPGRTKREPMTHGATAFPPASASPPDDDAVPCTLASGCPGCGHPIAEEYCGRCGERRADVERLSLRRMATDVAEHVANLDVKLLRTLALLLVRPGFLLVEYRRGVRARYTRPLTLLLIVTSLFVLAGPRTRITLRDPALAVSHAAPGSAIARRAAEVSRATGETPLRIGRRVRASTGGTRRLLFIVFIPFLAGALALVHAGRRSYAAEHVVLAVHLFTTFLVVLAAAGPVARAAEWTARQAGLALDPERAPWLIALVLLVPTAALLAHVYAALRRAYGGSPSSLALRSLGVLGGMVVGTFAYFFLVDQLVLRAM